MRNAPIEPQQPKRVLTVMFVPQGDGVIIWGVCEDETVIVHVAFPHLTEALSWLNYRYHATYKVVCNISPNVRRT